MIKHSFLILIIIFSMIILSACSDYNTEDYYYLEDRVAELESDIEDLEGENFSLKEDLEYTNRFLKGVYYKSLQDNYVHKIDCYNIQDDDFLAINEVDLDNYEKCPNCFGDDEYYYDWIDTPCYYIEGLEISGDYTFTEYYKKDALAFVSIKESSDDLEEIKELVFIQPNDNYYHKLICDNLIDPNAWTRITASNRGYEKCPICFSD